MASDWPRSEVELPEGPASPLACAAVGCALLRVDGISRCGSALGISSSAGWGAASVTKLAAAAETKVAAKAARCAPQDRCEKGIAQQIEAGAALRAWVR